MERKALIRTGRIGCLSLLFACSSNIKLPSTHFSSSETVGGDKQSINLGLVSTYQLSSTPDLGGDPLTEDNQIQDSSTFLLQGGIGLADFLDIEYQLGASTPLYIGTKINLLGDDLTSSKQWSPSVSLRTGLGFYVKMSEVPEEEIKSDPNTPREYVYSGYTTHIELLLGLKVLDPLLVYSSFAWSKFGFVTDFQTGTQQGGAELQNLNTDGQIKYFNLGALWQQNGLMAGGSVSLPKLKIKGESEVSKLSPSLGIHAGLVF